MKNNQIVSVAVGGLALLLVGLLCGLVPFSVHVPERRIRSNSNTWSEFSSPAHDRYCGSAWVQESCSAADFGALPQLAVLFTVLGIVGLGAALVILAASRSASPERRQPSP